MKNIKLVYQYDGSGFWGFQRQPEKRTVQGELERGLNKILREDINLISSGRTDRGVHAKKQVSNFFTNSPIPLKRLKYALENFLPRDIKILEVDEVSKEFHSRFSAKTRAYEFLLTHNQSVFEGRYTTRLEKEVQLDRLEEIMEIFIGKHNFESFRLTDCNGNNPVREIFEIKCYRVDSEKIAIYIKGNAFLKTQIRIMVGSALAVYYGKKSPDYIENKLKNPKPNGEKIAIDGSGLYLYEVNY